MKQFNVNGVNYKVVNGLVHKQGRGILDPVYKGDSSVMDEYCRTRGLKLYQRPSGIHAYGNQLGSRSQ